MVRYAPGEGFGLKKVMDPFAVLDDVDYVMFTDIGRGRMADFLRRAGYRVFGAGIGEILEFNRLKAKEYFRDLGIKFAETKILQGVDDVIAFLKRAPKNEKWYIKLNVFRGDMETLGTSDSDQAEIALVQLKDKFGPLAKRFVFGAEKAMEGIEPGWDMFFNGHEFLTPFMFGAEFKTHYVSKWMTDIEEVDFAADFMRKITPLLQEFDYRGAFSTEGIFDGDDFYMIDFTSRFGLPLSAIYADQMQNYTEVITAVADGKNVSPKMPYKFSSLIALPTRNLHTWIVVESDPSVHVRYYSAVKVGDKVYSLPRMEANEPVVSVISGGDTMQEAIEKVTKDCEKVKFYGKLDLENLDELVKGIVEPFKTMGYGGIFE
jgi:phosphoribosylamine-glycine ligase